MAKKKEVYHVKPLTEEKKNIITSLTNEYYICHQIQKYIFQKFS
ncbi:hypothetical protein ODY73_06990 [Aerococcus sp. JJEM-2022b]|nr:hypothetical protein [Aerococcus mictus]MCY3084184.1 hypothetical protein [Aerococcus mictus]